MVKNASESHLKVPKDENTSADRWKNIEFWNKKVMLEALRESSDLFSRALMVEDIEDDPSPL